MYRKYNWSNRGSLILPSSQPQRRLSFSSSYDWTPTSPSQALRIDSNRDFEAALKGLKQQILPSTQITNKSTNTIFFKEYLNDEVYFSFPVEEILLQKKTDFQEIKILKTKFFGKCLVSDNHIQGTESDECIFHESLVHPALLSHPNPQTVFIGGGVELATAREVLKHHSVKRVVMVDIDKEAVEICLEMLSEWNEGILNNPKLEIIYGDADAYLKTCGIKFDVIIMNLSDPVEGSPSWKLYTKEFYERIKDENMESPYSIFCTQSTGASLNLIVDCFSIIHNTLSSVFEEVKPFRTDIVSFGCMWGFHICSSSPTYILSESTHPEFIDKEIKLEHRLGESGERTLRHYDGTCHAHMFNLSKFEKEACCDEARIFTNDWLCNN